MDHTLRIGDTQFFVRTEGSGTPLLLAHGFPLDHHMWDDIIPPLAEHYQVIAPDLRGFGCTDGFQEIVPMEMLADDLDAILDALGVARPIIFCGLSMGGYVGWQMWRRHRDRLAALIQLDTRAAADTEIQARARGVNAQQTLSAGMQDVPDAMLPKLLGETTRENKPEVVKALRAMILRQDPKAAAGAQRGMAQRPDVESWLPEITLPTLVLCGSQDVISPPDEMRAFAEKLPQGQFVEIPDAGHMVPMESPEATTAAILSFCQNLG